MRSSIDTIFVLTVFLTAAALAFSSATLAASDPVGHRRMTESLAFIRHVEPAAGPAQLKARPPIFPGIQYPRPRVRSGLEAFDNVTERVSGTTDGVEKKQDPPTLASVRGGASGGILHRSSRSSVRGLAALPYFRSGTRWTAPNVSHDQRFWGRLSIH